MGATLEEIRSRARKADPRDAAEFANIVKVATELDGVSCRGLARYLMVVPSTVSRWARGRSIPGPLARKTIMDMLGEVDHDRLGNG